MDGREATEDGTITEIYSIACHKISAHLQLDCCSSHSVLPWQGKHLMIHSITDPSQKPLHLTGHHGDVSAVSFGKGRDPLMLCSASEDYVIAWDVERCYRKAREGAIASGTVIGTLIGKIVHLSFCPLDKRVSACSGSNMYILNSKKEEVLAVLKGHLGPLTASVFFPWDPNVLVSTSEDRTFKVWDVTKEEILYQSAVLSSCPLLCVYVTEEGRQLITGSADGQVWHHTVLDDYKCRLVMKLDLPNMEQTQRRIQESQAQQISANSTGDGVMVEMAKPVLGIFTFKPLPYSGHTKERDGSCLWIGSSDGLYLVNLASSELLMALRFKDYPDLSITLAGSLSVTQKTDCDIHCAVTSMFQPRMALWDIRLPGQLDRLCSQLEKALPGQELSVVPSSPPMPTSPLNAELTRRDPKPPKKTGPGPGKPGGVKDQSVVFHAQVKSSGYAVGSQRKMFTPKTNIQKKAQRPTKKSKKIEGLLSEYPSGLAAPTVQHALLSASPTHTPVFCLQYSGDGKQILCGLGDTSVLLYKSSLTGNPSVYTGHSKALSSVCCSHSCGWILSASEDQSVRIWAAGSREPTLTMGSDRFSAPVRSAQFYYLDKFLLLASGSSVHLFLSHLDTSRDDLKRYEQKSFSRLVRRFSTKSGTDITAMSAINDFFSYIVLSCGADRSIQVFDLNVGSVAMEIPESHSRAAHHITQNKGSMYSAQAQDSYNLFLTSAITDGIKLWDLRTSRCVRKYEGHVNRCHQCTAAFSPCGRFVATGSEDNCAYVYDIRSSSYLHKLQRHTDTVLNVAFNPAAPELLTGTLDGRLGLFRPEERASLL
ncbi:WD repeat-containing protein 27 isoform X2 [Clupea harengus]|uniref:WD repeat-containing protein 27 isoform X2 n=1 Tax=Clupea harengus TaxID=7950 RepID=A0A6P8G7N9_CLUHA|nr:WD repeat-containing protein 27 isoform X2 [Clupea harengus]